MPYVDGFVLVLPKKNLAAYTAMSKKCGKVWKEHGALQCRECVGDDLAVKVGVAFPKRVAAKPGETVMYACIAYKSRAHRDRVNAKVMKDPRIGKMITGKPPFDCTRMSFGGFKTVVDM